jgi:tight adherence protein C
LEDIAGGHMSVTTLTQYLGIAASVFLGAGFAIVIYIAAKYPTEAPPITGLLGMRRREALRDVSGWAQLEPLIRWLGARVQGFIGANQTQTLSKDIQTGGDFLGLRPQEFVGLSVFALVSGGIIGALLGYLADMPLLFVLVPALALALPYMALKNKVRERMLVIGRTLPSSLDILSLSMSAGKDLPGAIAEYVEKARNPKDPLVEEYRLVLMRTQTGQTRRQALEEFMDRVPVDSVREFVFAVVQAEARGNPVADALAVQAEASRRKRSVTAEEKAAKAAVKLIAPIMLLFFCILLLIVGPMIIKLQSTGLGG